MGKKVGRVATAVSTGGLSELGGGGIGGLKNLFLGKKDPGTPDRMQELDPSLKRVVDAARAQQERAVSGFGKMLDQNERFAEVQGARMFKQARQDVEDQSRQAQRAVAQRGLGSSSVGLSAMLNPSKQLGKRMGEIQASIPELQLQNLQNVSGGINQILGAEGAQRALVQGRESMGRQGGLAPLLGAGIGGLLGGSAGATAGLGIGQAATRVG